MTREEQAEATFAEGFNCCQAVVSAFCDDYDMSREDALKMAAGFGGGMGRAEVCGAVTGALMVLGLAEARLEGDRGENKARIKDICGEFQDRFQDQFGSLLCRGVLGYDMTVPAERAQIQEKGLTKTICPEAVKGAVAILEKR